MDKYIERMLFKMFIYERQLQARRNTRPINDVKPFDDEEVLDQIYAGHIFENETISGTDVSRHFSDYNEIYVDTLNHEVLEVDRIFDNSKAKRYSYVNGDETIYYINRIPCTLDEYFCFKGLKRSR